MERRGGELHFIDKPDCSFAEAVAQHPADAELQDKHPEGIADRGVARVDHLQQDQCQHVGHRVITPRLKFQQWLDIVLEVHLLGSQDREDRC